MTNRGAEFKQTQGEQEYGPNWKQGSKNKNKTYFGIEIGMEMEWKKMSERKLKRYGIVNGARHLDGELNPR